MQWWKWIFGCEGAARRGAVFIPPRLKFGGSFCRCRCKVYPLFGFIFQHPGSSPLHTNSFSSYWSDSCGRGTLHTSQRQVEETIWTFGAWQLLPLTSVHCCMRKNCPNVFLDLSQRFPHFAHYRKKKQLMLSEWHLMRKVSPLSFYFHNGCAGCSRYLDTSFHHDCTNGKVDHGEENISSRFTDVVVSRLGQKKPRGKHTAVLWLSN